MRLAAEGDHGIGVLAAQPAGPAQPAEVVPGQKKLTNFIRSQVQAHVIVQRGAQHEPDQHAQRLVVAAGWQKVMKARPIQIEDVDAELAASVAHLLAQHQAFAQLAVGHAQSVALLL